MIFADTGLNITTSGVRHLKLGALLGDASFSESFVAERFNKWEGELARLADIAAVQPHLAFCALTQGLVSRWTYLCGTADNTSEFLRLLEDVVQKTILPSLTGHAPPGPEIRSFFGLPARLGGLENRPRNPSEKALEQGVTSRAVTRPTPRAE